MRSIFTQQLKQNAMKTNTAIDLTIGNASKVSTVINKNHPEWGTKKFEFNGQPLTSGFAHVIGTGCNSAVLFESEFKFWSVASFK